MLKIVNCLNYLLFSGKGFYTQFKLTEHQRVHSGEKPFTCTVCATYKCTTKSNLIKHLRVHEKRRSNTVIQTGQNGKVGQSSNFGARINQHLLTKDSNIQSSISSTRTSGDLGTNGYSALEQVSPVHNQPNMCPTSPDNVYTNMTSLVMDQQHYETHNISSYNSTAPSNSLSVNMTHDSYYGNSQTNSTGQDCTMLTSVVNIVSPTQY